MQHAGVSRRRFALLAGAAGAGQIGIRAAGPLTADSVVKRIQAELGGDWSNGPDGFKAGDPATPVRGIATTAMATMTVLRQSASAGANLVLTYEPTFFGRADGYPPAGRALMPGAAARGLSPDDPVYNGKKEFIEKNGLVVFRLRDHWQARKQDEMLTGLAASLGWTKHRVKPDDALYDIPTSSAEETVAFIRGRLKLRGGLRAVGDRAAKVRRVLLYPGVMNTATFWRRFPEVDLIVAGEVREWENTHYAADAATAGEKRGLVTIGRVVSEDPGMSVCAAWLKDVVPEVPARWITAGDPYWRAA